MKRKKLTAISIPSLSAGDYPDSVVPDLILRVGVSRRTWTYRYRRGAERKRQTLGYFPRMGIAEARDAARKAAERIDRGAKPAPSDPHPRSTDVLTLGDLIDRYAGQPGPGAGQPGLEGLGQVDQDLGPAAGLGQRVGHLVRGELRVE